MSQRSEPRPAPKKRRSSSSEYDQKEGRPARNYKLADVEILVEASRRKFAQHPLLKRLESSGTIQDFRVLARCIAFYVLCFQDMLRLVREGVRDSKLKVLTQVHEAEDKGHEKWYLMDLERFGISLDVSWIFGPAHEVARNVSYEIVAQILGAKDDWSRLAVLLALEGTGAECFGRAIGFLERLGADRDLTYFARAHQQVERDHKVFDRKARDASLLPSLSRQSLEYCHRAVDQTFGSMTKLLNYIEESIVASTRG